MSINKENVWKIHTPRTLHLHYRHPPTNPEASSAGSKTSPILSLILKEGFSHSLILSLSGEGGKRRVCPLSFPYLTRPFQKLLYWELHLARATSREPWWFCFSSKAGRFSTPQLVCPEHAVETTCFPIPLGSSLDSLCLLGNRTQNTQHPLSQRFSKCRPGASSISINHLVTC